MSYAVVRTDNMAGTDVRGQLVSVKYMGADGATETAIENGNVLKLGALVDGEREIYVGGDVAANTAIDDVVLVASVEIMYDERKRNLDEFVNEAGAICRGYHIHSGDTFSVTAEALSGTGAPTEGNIVELAAGTKLAFASSATSGSTQVGRIIAVDVVGRYTYYVIKVN